MKHKIKLLTFVLLLITAFSSCEREYLTREDIEGPLTETTLTFRVPGSTLPKTRALKEENHDRHIKEVTVLEFRGGEYLHSRAGTIVQSPSSTSNEIKFKITLATGTCDLVILANANDIITKCYPTGIPAKTSKATIAAALQMTIGDTTGESDKWNTDTLATTPTYHIPMWGELQGAVIPEGDLTGENITFTKKHDLMRMVAKVDVTIKDNILPATFTLTEVHFFNYQRKGLLILDLAQYNATPKKLPTLPAEPVGLTGCERGQKWGDGEAGLTGNKLTGEIFTFASPAGTDYTSRPCVVVGGKFGGSSKNTYYRIDFVDAGGEYLPLLRNYKYDIVVTKVSGEGYIDVPTAYSSRPLNLESEVIKWNEADMNDVVFDGVNFLSVSPGELDIPQAGLEDTDGYVITVATDVDIYKDEADQKNKNWTAKIYYDEEGTKETDDDGNQWLRLSQYYGDKIYTSGDASTKLRVTVLADASSNPDERNAWIHFKAGRLTYIVKVTQLDYTPAYVWITDEHGNSLSSLSFSSENPVAKKFRVTWSPKSKPLQIERMPGADPFMYTDDDNTSDWTEIPVGNSEGVYEFTIKPTTYTEAQLKENPFKATSMTMRFITSDALGNVAETGINLRQMDYKIILGGFSDGYVGYEVNADVRANARWTMEVVSGGEYLQSALSSTGPANIRGESFKYQYRELGGKGSVKFRFTSPEGLFEDTVVTVSLMPISHLFAKSNIVLKDGKLIFAETIEDNVTIPIPANSQGVFFKWGSLVALSTPCENYNMYRGSPFVASTDIVFRSNAAIDPDTYAGVPYYTPPIDVNQFNDKFDWHLSTYPRDYSRPGYYGGYDELNGLGDICRYISDKGWVKGRWRIPTGYEYYSVLRGETPVREGINIGVVYGSYSWPEITGRDGLTAVTSGVLIGNGVDYSIDNKEDGQNIAPNQEDKIYFPASGHFDRDNGDRGAMWHVGRYGQYHYSSWPRAVAFVGNNSFGQMEGSGIDTGAYTIRCIRDGSYSQ